LQVLPLPALRRSNRVESRALDSFRNTFAICKT
jgi:hypothetical protein